MPAFPSLVSSGRKSRSGWVTLFLTAAAILAAPSPHAYAQPTPASATIDTTSEAGEDAAIPKRRFTKWNEYDGPISTFFFGMNFMTDAVTYIQDDKSKQQIDVSPEVGLRDFRLAIGGRFKTKRPISWQLAYMYDGADDDWRFRTTGIMVGLPELSGEIFIGRQKEGYSSIKYASGIWLWGIERSQTLDAFAPILGDGIKYKGYFQRPRLFVNVGYYTDTESEKEKFSTYDRQVVSRVGWQPILSESDRKVLHVAVMERECKPDDGFLREKARPGAYQAPYFLDTGKFAANHSRTFGLEALYRSGPWLFASEYDWQQDEATSGEKPVFHGGEASVVWLITGETRPYNARNAYFQGISPTRTVFEGGPGAWEAVLNLSYADFDDGSFQGGKFWRVTPMVNWHLADYLRLELVYGLGKLDRFGITGTTQFFQSRLQIYF